MNRETDIRKRCRNPEGKQHVMMQGETGVTHLQTRNADDRQNITGSQEEARKDVPAGFRGSVGLLTP